VERPRLGECRSSLGCGVRTVFTTAEGAKVNRLEGNRREAAKQNSPGALALGRRDTKRHALKGRPMPRAVVWHLKELGLSPDQDWRGGRSCSCLVFAIEKYRFLGSDWPAEGGFIEAPQRERAPWLLLAEWIRRLLCQRVDVEAVTAYILNQTEHHKKFSSQEEIREIFDRHRVTFDERYVWD
jgi:hypothetical protein